MSYSAGVLAYESFGSFDCFSGLQSDELEQTLALFVWFWTESITEVSPQCILGSAHTLVPGLHIIYFETQVAFLTVPLLEGAWDSIAVLIA